MKLHSIPDVLQRLTGRRVPPGTWRRWIFTGVNDQDGKRVRLQVVRLGGRVFTTDELVREFLKATNRTSCSKVEMPSKTQESDIAKFLDREVGTLEGGISED